MAIMVATRTCGWLLAGMLLATAEPAGALVDRQAAQAAGLTVYWQRSVPLAKDEHLARIARLDEYVYLITNQGGVIALDAGTGVFRWAQTLVSPDIRLHGPTHGPADIYFTSILGIHCLDRKTGRLEDAWKQGFTPAGPVASDGQILLGGGINGRVYAVRLRDRALVWEFDADGMVAYAPVLHAGQFVAVSQGGGIYCGTKQDKVRLWTASLNGPVTVQPASFANRLYVSGTEQALYCFDMASGKTLWRARMPAPLYNAPRATADHVYQPIEQHGFWCLDPATGKEVWNLEEAVDLAAEHENLAWLISLRSSLLGVEKATGQIRHEVPMTASLWFVNQVDDAIYLGTPGGTVACIRPASVGYLPYRRVQEVAAGVTTRPAAARPELAEQLPLPPNLKRPIDYLKSPETITPIGGHRALPAPAQGAP